MVIPACFSVWNFVATKSYDMNIKKVIVLGGSSGIGLATAKAALEAGAEVSIVSGNPARLALALGAVSGASGFVVDLRQEQEIKAFFEKAGRFDHLVYTAGENLSLATLAETDLDSARAFFNIRYWGALTAVKYAAPYVNAGGSINLTSGIASSRPGKGWALASSICGAMEGLTRALAVELAPIRVNCVKPGVVKTPLWDSMDNREQFYKATEAALLVGRVGEAENIAQAFLYLMNQPFGTGQALVIDGGAELV
jgi:NAD(P)-dependent dehydrogenase (short-subunit alcohol dehydrogenase family)